MEKRWFFTITLILLGSIAIAQTATKIMNRAGSTVNPSRTEDLEAIGTIIQTPRYWGTIDVGTMPPITIPPISVTSGTTPVYSYDVLSLINSSTTTLASNATFTGDWHNTEGFAQTTMMVTSDQQSATSGWILQHSSDGTNVDYVSSRTYHTVGAGRVFTVPTRGKWIRVIYRNGSSAQGTFRLQTYLRVMPSSAAIQELDLDLTEHVQALVTKSNIVGLSSAGGGAYVPVKVNPSGSLEVNANQPAPYQTIGTIQGGTVNVGQMPITTVAQGSAPWRMIGTIDIGSMPPITMTSGTTPVTQATDPWKVVGRLHTEIHDGTAFTVSDWRTIINAVSHNTLFISTPSTTPLHLAYTLCADQPHYVGLFKNTSWTTQGVRQLTPYNTNDVVATTGPGFWGWSTQGFGAWGTIGNLGIMMRGGSILTAACHEIKRDLDEVILAPNTKYILHMRPWVTSLRSSIDVIFYW